MNLVTLRAFNTSKTCPCLNEATALHGVMLHSVLVPSIAVGEPMQFATQGVLFHEFPRTLSKSPKCPFPAQPLATEPFPHTKR